MADAVPPVLDETPLARLTRLGGTELVDRMIDLFMENAPERVARVERGAASGDVGAVERAAHSLKSMAANVGAMQLSALADALELAAAQQAPDLDLAARAAELRSALDTARDALLRRRDRA